MEEEIKVGDIRMSPGGVSTVWVRYPLSAANKIAAAEKIQIGWAIVGVQLLESRPLQCFKCMEGGHVQQRCPNKTDRSRMCYRCGQAGHEAKDCREIPNYPICKDRNLPANHRSGGKSCPTVKKGTRGLALNKLSQKPQSSYPVAKQKETSRPPSSAAKEFVPTAGRRRASEEEGESLPQ